MEPILTIRTGWGGLDLFQEIIEKQTGRLRIYSGKKIPRFVRKLDIDFIKHPYRGYYKLVKDPNYVEPAYEEYKLPELSNYNELSLEVLQEALKEYYYGKSKH